MPERFIVVGSNIIENNGKILMVKEGKEIADDKWNLPAGSMENFENPEECAVREAKEETNLNIKPLHLVGIYIDTSDNNEEKVINFVFYSKSKGEKVHINKNDTVKDFKWFNPEEIKNLDLRADYIKQAIKDFSKNKSFQKDLISDLS